MIKCERCSNKTKFVEVHVGGKRQHVWEQNENGRIIFSGSNYDAVDDTYFECGKCGHSMNDQYRKFLQILFEFYSEEKHGV